MFINFNALLATSSTQTSPLEAVSLLQHWVVLVQLHSLVFVAYGILVYQILLQSFAISYSSVPLNERIFNKHCSLTCQMHLVSNLSLAGNSH